MGADADDAAAFNRRLQYPQALQHPDAAGPGVV
jgi:hypothetical protein